MPPLLSYTKRPFARLLLPLALGILLRENLLCYFPPPVDAIPLPLLIVTGVVALLISFLPHSPAQAFKRRHLFGIGCFLLFIGTGVVATEIRHQPPPLLIESELNAAILLIQLESEPSEKSNSFQVAGRIVEEIDSTGRAIQLSINALIYLPKDSLSPSIQKGDLLVGSGIVRPLRNQGNPYAYDYTSVLNRQGIYHTVYLSSFLLKKQPQPFSLIDTSLRIRNRLISILRESGLSSESFGFIAALTLGYKTELPADTRTEFSEAGLSHILAVSGLHTGIIFLLLLFLLSPLRVVRAERLIYLLCILLLWGYAFVTGLSASVVRAVCMISILLSGKIIYKKGDTLNILFATAFGMLLFNPYYLYDLGFQLSFCALLSILIFSPLIRDLLIKEETGTKRRKSGVQRMALKGVELLSVTLGVQVLTLPLSIFYFNVFPLWFIPANLLVLPLLTPFLLSCFLLIALGFLCGPITGYTVFVEGYAKLILGIVHLTQNLPGSNYFNQLFIDRAETALWMISGISFLFFLRNRKAFPLIFFLSSILSISIYREYNAPETRHELILFNQREANALHLVKNRSHFLFSHDSALNKGKLERIVRPFVIAERLDPLIYIPCDSILSDQIIVHRPFLLIGDKRIMHLTDNNFRRSETTHKAVVDILILGDRFTGSLHKMNSLVEFKQVVLSGNLRDYIARNIKAECDSLHIDCFDVRQEGAFRFDLSQKIKNPDLTSD